MVRVEDKDLKTVLRQSSKGNQLKWEKAHIWYKADYVGYEGLAEYLVSALLEYSTLNAEQFIRYHTEEVGYKNAIYRGCKSIDFLPEGWQLITLERLFYAVYGKSLYKSIFQIQGVEERAIFLTEQIEKITGLTNFGGYLSYVMTVDALFLNEDRHTHNLAVLMDSTGEYHYCPLFDHGCSLLSDTTIDYPERTDVIELIPRVQAKTLSENFDEQLDAIEALYGQNMKFYYNEHIIQKLLDEERYYPRETKERVKEILLQQKRKYGYLFR